MWYKSHLINITKDTFIALITGSSKGFWSSVSEMGTKTKYIFLITNHNITFSNFTLLHIMFILSEMILFPLLSGIISSYFSGWNWAGPCGAPGHKSLSVSPISFLQGIGFIQPPWPSLSSKGQVQTVANQGRQGVLGQGRSSQETTVQPWGRVLVPPQGVYITISLSFLQILKLPPRERS